jgi:hypothetical protein
VPRLIGNDLFEFFKRAGVLTRGGTILKPLILLEISTMRKSNSEGLWATRLLTAGGSCSKMLVRSWGRLHLPAVFTFLEAGGGRIPCLQAR